MPNSRAKCKTEKQERKKNSIDVVYLSYERPVKPWPYSPVAQKPVLIKPVSADVSNSINKAT